MEARRVKSKSSRDRRVKGDPHTRRRAGQAPNGEAKRRSANADTGHGSAQPRKAASADTSCGHGSVSAAQPSAEQVWLEKQLAGQGAEKPHAKLNGKGVWMCRDGRRLLGRLSRAAVDAQNVDAVMGLFDLTSAVVIELDLKQEQRSLLWAVSDQVTHCQRQITLALLRAEHEGEGVAPATHAYRVFGRAAQQWREKQREPIRGVLLLSGDLMAFASKQACDAVTTWQATAQAEKSPPWWKARSFGVKEVGLGMNCSKLAVQLKLLGADPQTRRCPEIVLSGYAMGGSAWAIIRRIVAGEYRARAGRVVFNQDRKRWQLKLSYSYPRPIGQRGAGALVVTPSLRSFVVLFRDDGSRAKQMDGESLISRKLAFAARRSAAGKHLTHQGRGSRGHGRKRFFRLLNRLRDTEARYVDTWCNEQGAFIAKTAISADVAEVLVDDWSTPRPVHPDKRLERLLRRFPAATLRDRILWHCQKRGVAARSVHHPPLHCPACGSNQFAQGPGGLCMCPECNLEIGLDVARAWRLLKAADSEYVDLVEVGRVYRANADRVAKLARESRKEEGKYGN